MAIRDAREELRSTPAMPAVREATRFGPYWLDARLAVGGTAEVYLARPVDAREAPARLIVKRLLPHIMSDPEGRTMFEREARLHAAVRHDNVVRLHDWGVTESGEPYLALEFVDGVDCFRLLRRLGQDGRSLGIPTATRVAIHVLDALSSVHAATDENGRALGIIHRDVTPSNVFLSKRGDVKLGDFGIARAATARATIRNGDGPVIKGKYAYLAPEQVGGDAFDHRADVFALACVLVEMILGRPLFSGSGQLAVLLAIRDCRLDPLVEAKASLPAGMFEVLERGLAREPAGRFESAAAFAAALEPFADTKEAARSSLAEEVFLIQTNPSASSMAAVRESMRALRTASGQRPAVVEERVLEPVATTPAKKGPPPLPAAPPISGKVPALKIRHVEEIDSLDGDGEQERPTSEYETLPSYVKTLSGHVTGPFTFAALVESLATGLVGKDDYVDFMGRGYRRVGDLDDLVRYLPAVTATSGGVLGLGTPDFEDDLRSTPFGTILLRILAKNETGVLFVELPESTLDTGTHKELYFVGGRLHHVSSSNAGELLGEYLVRRGMLSRSELDFALAVLSRYNGRIGDTLISLGLASAVDMFRAIRDQGRDPRVGRLLVELRTVTFYRGQTAPHVEFPLELEIPELLLAGLEAKQAKAEDFVEEYRGLLDKFVALPSVPNRTYRHVVWPAVVTRIVQMVTTPRRLRELMVSATRDGDLTAPEVLRAIEVAILSGLLRYQG